MTFFTKGEKIRGMYLIGKGEVDILKREHRLMTLVGKLVQGEIIFSKEMNLQVVFILHTILFIVKKTSKGIYFKCTML